MLKRGSNCYAAAVSHELVLRALKDGSKDLNAGFYLDKRFDISRERGFSHDGGIKPKLDLADAPKITIH